MTGPAYAELHCLSNFTFLRGASHPEELVAQAASLGYHALALTDECSVAGVVRAHQAAIRHGIKLIIGSEFRTTEGVRFIVLARDREGYGHLSTLVTRARRAAGKGSYTLALSDLTPLAGCHVLWLPSRVPEPEALMALKARCGGQPAIVAERFCQADDHLWRARLTDLSLGTGSPVVAASDVHMHVRTRQMLQDTLTAIRLRRVVGEISGDLYPNGERHLRPRETLAALYPAPWLAESVRMADECQFSLTALRYSYPREWLPPGDTPTSRLAELVAEGARRRWPDGMPARLRGLADRELALIAELGYEAYFLTVCDVVAFARSRGILCQGRGSAANSVACYCLGITEVDPGQIDVLFERFISRERNEPPDIDVDFEHERREEVLSYLFTKYGRDRAAMTASVITYRIRSAVRDVGRALGLGREDIDRLARAISWWEDVSVIEERLAGVGVAPDAPLARRFVTLVREIIGFPRHLSQHSSGIVLSDAPLAALVPIENAAMPGRTVLQWDKDDLDAVGLMKIDCLGLGMLSALHRSFDLISRSEGRPFGFAEVPREDQAVYQMVSEADTVGVFQIESRAQMSMLPRLRPRCFYDLVIQVAIVRPGPIQGGMVHPYLRRRQGVEPVDYPTPEVRAVLERTLGVPIFQEQVIRLAMVAAGFSPGEADALRRSMATWKRTGLLKDFEQRLVEGMRTRGYDEAYAGRIFRQILGFGEYGFPESHAASFAWISYVSAFIKCHYPAVYLCALLNSQPLGFYGTSQLIADARAHGVSCLPVDVRESEWDTILVPEASGGWQVRLGLREVKGFGWQAWDRLRCFRTGSRHPSWSQLPLNAAERTALVASGACDRELGGRRQAYWVLSRPKPLALAPETPEGIPLLRRPELEETVRDDYASLGFSLRGHPVEFWRSALGAAGIWSVAEAKRKAQGMRGRIGGLVVLRQRPPTAAGVVFVTLEDETGSLNIVCRADVVERGRPLLASALLMVEGIVQRSEGVLHILARALLPWHETLRVTDLAPDRASTQVIAPSQPQAGSV